jgi:tetratricopeptide (TPR) repeat protein
MLSDLSATPAAELIRRLSAERKSGDLQVRVARTVKTIFFDHGRVVFAASNLKKDRLGEALLALGRITDDEFKRASDVMKADRRRRLGDALVQAGVLERNELGRSVARQVKRIVISLFSFRDGVASFEERKCVIPLEFMVSLSVHRLLFVGIKTMTDRDLILTGLGNLDRWVTLASVPPFNFGKRKCSAEELDILEQCRGRVTLRRLAWSDGGLPTARLRAVYGLLAAGILEEVAREGRAERQPIIQMETTTFLLSALRSKPDPSARDAIREEIEGELGRSAQLDRETWLKVSRSAPREELAKALEEKMERYHSLLEAVGDDPELKTDIELILGRASSMLRLARQTVPAGAREEEPQEEEVPESVAEEPPPPRRPAPSPSPKAPPAPAAPHAPAVPRSDGSFVGSAQIEHLLMEGEVRMTVSDYANAVNTYAKLVDLAPKVPAYHMRLALAMAFYPRTAKQAEREFLEVVRLEPDNADYHFQFGLYYKAMKVRSRAIAEMRTAVGLNPRHKAARAELEALSPKDSALTSLKKLFR